jgi:hypothetical protein
MISKEVVFRNIFPTEGTKMVIDGFVSRLNISPYCSDGNKRVEWLLTTLGAYGLLVKQYIDGS